MRWFDAKARKREKSLQQEEANESERQETQAALIVLGIGILCATIIVLEIIEKTHIHYDNFDGEEDTDAL